jgi:hypothetical protein
MVPFLFTPRENHNVRDAAEYAAAQAAHIERRRAAGARFEVHVDPAPLVARVDANSWIVDCSCGAGNATDPVWGVAYCFGCGAQHFDIAFPDDPTLIEALLVARPEVGRRGWDPGQSLSDLADENASIGAVIPDVVTVQLAEISMKQAAAVDTEVQP